VQSLSKKSVVSDKNVLALEGATNILNRTMDEIINLVVQKTGISQDDAQKAVQVVIDSLKSKLPAPIAAQVDSFLSGGVSGGVNALEAEAGNILKSEIGGFLGKH
jgi:uncharacterized protein (DUF2267 family)